jgi:hypothetical protein
VLLILLFFLKDVPREKSAELHPPTTVRRKAYARTAVYQR